jgi:8-oxo-dGTP pyrophosphatase MutT (NUDIX family)
MSTAEQIMETSKLTPAEYAKRAIAHANLGSGSALQVIAARDRFLETHGDTAQSLEEYCVGEGRWPLLVFLQSLGIQTIQETECLFEPDVKADSAETRADDVEFSADPTPIIKKDDEAVKKQAAGILFITSGGKVLVGLRAEQGEYQGHWGIFGGHHEEGETLEFTAIREVLEETGHEVEGRLQLIAQTLVDGTEFTYFVNVCKPFEVVLNEEHVSYQWLSMGELMGGPVIPGLLEVINSPEVTALRLTKMNELHIARAMTNGSLPSPQKYANVSMYKMRITGTGKAFRRGQPEKKDKDGKVTQVEIKDEYVFRRPESYLNQDFLDRCQGLAVIFQHPEKKVLNSIEFSERLVGMMVCPFILGKEVWGIAKIYDEDTVTILDNENMSTSPSVVFHDRTVNSTIALNDGSVLLIEGEPSLLDHLAICEQGVWDKGGDPYGIISESATATQA